MRDAERLLIRYLATTPQRNAITSNTSAPLSAPSAAPLGGGAGGASRASRYLSEVDTGLLVISLHLLRQTVERHKVLLSAGERGSFFEDLEDLESEQYDCDGKMLVLQRIYRTQPALLAGGGAMAAGAAHADLGPGMQLDRTRR